MAWQRAAELLENRQYEQVAQLLQEKQEAVQQSGQMTLVILLAAAYQLCLTCQEFKREQELHRRAAADAARREKELLGHILPLLDVFIFQQEIPADLTLAQNKVLERPLDEALSFIQKVRRLLTGESSADQVAELETTTSDWQPTTLFVESVEQRLSNSQMESTSELEDKDRAEPPHHAQTEVEGNHITEKHGSESKIKAEEELPVPESTPEEDSEHSLVVYCLGPFQVYLGDEPVESWPSGKGKSIFKYLVTHRELPVAKEVLMELFWPEANPDAARNNLNVAIYGLRQALRNVSTDLSHVLFEEDAYLLNPRLNTWVDVEEFLEHYRLARKLAQDGQAEAAVQEYITAETLYQGEFLAEDRYDGWITAQRQYLQEAYLGLLEYLSRYQFERGDDPACINTCLKMLAEDLCREEAHRLLMRCYYRQGQRYLALRQYQTCARSLKEELDVTPSQVTRTLFHEIKSGKPV